MEWEALRNTQYVSTEALMETPSKWSIIHSLLACVKDGKGKTPRDVMEEVKQEISENKDYYSTIISCADQYLREFEIGADTDMNVIAEALANVFKINIMILSKNEKQLFYLKEECDYISPNRVKQSVGRIALTVDGDGHFFPLLNLKEVQNWLPSDRITNIDLTDVESGVVRRLDLANDVTMDARDGNLYFLLKDLDNDLKYKCKIDILNEDGKVDELQSKEFSIKDQVFHNIQSQHIKINSHDQDGSLSKWVTQEKDFKTNISYSFESNTKFVPVKNWISDCDKYVETNLIENNNDYLKEWMIFPPIYMDVTKSKTKEIAQMFKKELLTTFNQGGLILVDYNSRKHSELICNLDTLSNHRKFDNRITILNKELNAILNIRVTESTNLKDVSKEVINCTEDSKDMTTLIEFMLKNNHIKDSKIQIHNIVCATNIGIDSLSDGIDQVQYLCAGCIPNVLTKELLSSDEKLGCWIKEVLRPFLRKESENKLKIQENKEDFQKIIGQITCFMANTSIQISSSSEFMHEHNVRIQLNDEQVNVVVNPMKHKLINGGFGVGKTIIGMLYLEFLARIAIECTKLFYISFDPFSLLDCFVTKHIESLQLKCLKDHLVNIEISNISVMAKNMAVSKLPSVSNMLEYIRKLQRETAGTCHIIMDEVNGDLINKLEVEKINKHLENMKENHITIILQPCERHRTETEAKHIFSKQTKVLNSFHYNDLHMKSFTLTRCMRNSVRIHKLVESAQEIITAEPSLYVHPRRKKNLEADVFQRKVEAPLSLHHKPSGAARMKDVETNETNDAPILDSFFEFLEEIPVHEEMTESNPSLLKPAKDLDTRHKLLDQGNLSKSSKYTTTTIQFAQIKEIGHSREGDLPRIVYLPSTKKLKSKCGDPKLDKDQLMILKLLICLMDIGVDCGDVIICNNSFEITFFQYALSIISAASILVFAPYTQNQEMPDRILKEEVITCLKDQNKIILTDMHSFCGMQCTRLIMPIHLQEKHERQNIIENIARATTEVIFIVMDSSSSLLFPLFPKEASFGRVVKQWEKKNLVKSSKAKIDKEKLPRLVEQLPTSKVIMKELSINREQTDELKRIQNIGYDYIKRLIRSNDIDAMKELLQIDPSIINTVRRDGDGRTPLIAAAQKAERLAMVELFIDHGVDVSLCDKYGTNAIHHCADHGHHRILSQLLKHTDGETLNKRNMDNRTPVWYASHSGNVACVHLLLKRNVDVDDNAPNKAALQRLITDYNK